MDSLSYETQSIIDRSSVFLCRYNRVTVHFAVSFTRVENVNRERSRSLD